ncbi:MAG: hypothetical protein OES79_05915, partial [Planctomycetota bacterium]|nr:hypothetical protein [Planctomycetota bacterium]
IRTLPHWRQKGATYFVTFNLSDALPAAKRNELGAMRRQWQATKPPPRAEATWTEYATTVFVKVEKWMDAGYGACWLPIGITLLDSSDRFYTSIANITKSAAS